MEDDRSKEELITEAEVLRKRVRELESPCLHAPESTEWGQACYRDLFGESKDPIYVSSKEGEILDVNRAAEELFGYQREELIGMNIGRLYDDPRDRDAFQREIEPTGAVKDYEVRLRRKDGARLHCLLSSTVRRSPEGGIDGYQGIIHDITAFRKAERALRLSEEKFSKVFMSSPDWIAITTLEDGRFLDVNDAFLRITGYAKEEVIGLTTQELGLWVDPRQREKMVELLRKDHVVRDQEARFRLKSGEVRIMLRSAELIELEGKTCVINVSRDITQRKQAEEEIRKLNRELERRVKELIDANRELDAFSSTVSHDLRTPLVSIGGFVRRLQKRYSGAMGPEGREMLDTIRERTEKMEELIEALLAFSRSGRQEMHLSDVNMDELVRSVFSELKSAVPERKIRLETGLLLPVYADKALVRQVIVNLMTNAFKFTRPRETAVIRVDSRAEDSGIMYSVKDNGVGFDMERAGRLFEVFHRLHSTQEFEGTGIGLSIVQRIVTRHGGSLWAEGMPGEGATFHFVIPGREQAENHILHGNQRTDKIKKT